LPEQGERGVARKASYHVNFPKLSELIEESGAFFFSDLHYYYQTGELE
jgi:hypothetical protein